MENFRHPTPAPKISTNSSLVRRHSRSFDSFSNNNNENADLKNLSTCVKSNRRAGNSHLNRSIPSPKAQTKVAKGIYGSDKSICNTCQNSPTTSSGNVRRPTPFQFLQNMAIAQFSSQKPSTELEHFPSSTTLPQFITRHLLGIKAPMRNGLDGGAGGGGGGGGTPGSVPLISPEEPITLYKLELERLQYIFHFPEEVAFQLTATEYDMFYKIPPLDYVRYVACDLAGTQLQDNPSPVRILVKRFAEVKFFWKSYTVTKNF